MGIVFILFNVDVVDRVSFIVIRCSSQEV